MDETLIKHATVIQVGRKKVDTYSSQGRLLSLGYSSLTRLKMVTNLPWRLSGWVFFPSEEKYKKDSQVDRSISYSAEKISTFLKVWF